MASGAYLGARLVAFSCCDFLCHGRMRMTAAAGGRFGRIGMDAARPVIAREQ
jgi:hypothetical protein